MKPRSELTDEEYIALWQACHRDSELLCELIHQHDTGKIVAFEELLRAAQFRLPRRRIDKYRKKSRDLPNYLGPRLHQKAVVTPSNEVENRENCEVVRQSIRSLAGVLRETAWLKWVDGLDVTEIAKKLNCPEKAVYARLHRAEKTLSESLKKKLVSFWN